MKKHSYGKLISKSWNWMVQILFRPFSLKKWIMLGIIILLAGQMGGGGFNINLGGDKADFNKIIDALKQKVPLATEIPAPLGAPIIPGKTEEITIPQNIAPLLEVMPKAAPFFTDPKTVGLLALIIIPLLLFVGLIIILWMWLNANFSFVFIDSIVRNDASLRIPFHRNKPRGSSYFWWNVIYGSLVLLMFGIIMFSPIVHLVKAVAKPPIDAVQILLIILPYIPILLISGILVFLITLLVRDFILPVMYKRKIGVLKAWGVFLGILRKNIGEILLYFLVRIGLSILALIASIILAIVGIIALLLIGGLLGLFGWLIYAITPGAAKPVIMVILILIGIPVFVILGFLFNLIFLPIPIFFRIFSIHVLGSIDETLDLFAAKTPEEIAAEGDDARYKKSMKLVWFTVLAPILVVLLGLLLAIAIPNFIGARGQTLQRRPLGIEEDVTPFEKLPVIPDVPAKKPALFQKTVTVYLKNGNSFEAKIENESEHNIAFRIKGGIFILPRDDILRIE